MKPNHILFKSLILLYSLTLFFTSQTVFSDPLVRQYFNNCEELPDSWTAEILNGTANWETDSLPDLIESIVPECIAYFSDDSLGAAAPPSTVQFTSPDFDASSYSTVYLDFDAYFFNFSQGTPTFELQVFDGTAYKTVFFVDENSFEGNHPLTRHYKVDLSDYINTNMNVRFYFDDGGTHSGSIGFDNIEIDGMDERTYLVLENFNENNGTTPTGWGTNSVTGPGEWNFGICPANASNETSIEGSYMAYFDDYSIGWGQLPSIQQMLSPAFDGRNYSDLLLEYDIHFRDYGDVNYLNVILDHNGTLTPIATYQIQNFSGNRFDDYVHASIDISEYRAETMQVIFEYGDGGAIEGDENGYGRRTYWAGIDNFKISGERPINDFCNNATPISLNTPCTSGTNIGAIFQGPTVACMDSAWSAIWYTFEAPATGSVVIETKADFDDLLNVYSGSCGNFTELTCINEDIYGFDGEHAQVSGLNSGETYYLRISGVGNSFGQLQGDLCLQIRTTDPPTDPPANDLCANAVPLTIDTDCVSGNNAGATFDGPMPSLNDKSDHSIWYSFEAPLDGQVTVVTESEFSDVITLFEGTCGSLNELFCNDEGQVLTATGLIPNETYHIQVSSFFNSLDGNICISLEPAECDAFFAVEFTNINHATCEGFDDGSMETSVTGGLPPYAYQWNDESASQHRTDLTQGTYMVTVTDAKECTATGQVSITGSLLAPEITGSLSFCGGNTTTLTGEVGFASYSWSTGEETASIEVNQAGTYVLTVLDDNNCMAYRSVEVVQDAAPEMPMVTSPAYYCQREKVTHTVTAGDGGPVYTPDELTIIEGDDVFFQHIAGFHPTQSLSSPIAFETFSLDDNNKTHTLTGLAEGVYPYECIPHAAQGMVGTITVMNDGADLEAMGENLLWYTSAMGGIGSPTKPIPDQSIAGTFYYYVSQTINGCESPRAEIQVIVAEPEAPSVVSPVHYCVREKVTHTITAGANGPVYTPDELTIVEGDDVLFQRVMGFHPTESLSDPQAWETFPLDSDNPTYLLTGLGEGVYPYKCIPHEFDGMLGTITVLDDGGNLEATGENLLWYTSATGGVGSPTKPIPNQSSAGTFYYYVSQTVGGCESPRAQIEVIVAEPEAPDVVSPAYYCQRDKVTHTVTAGDGGPVYSPDELTIIEGDEVLFQQVNGSHPTRSLSNPIAWEDFPLDDNNPTYTLTGLAEGVYPYECIPHAEFGMTGTITVTDDGGDLEATGENLLWYDSATGGVGSPTKPIPDQSNPGTFYYYVSQTVNGCESPRSEIQVIVRPEPIVEITGNLELCNGRTTTLTATEGFESYSWNNGSSQQEITANVITDYTVIATDINGCTSSATVTVVEGSDCCPDNVVIEYENDNTLPELTETQSYIRAGDLTGAGNVEVLNGQNVAFEAGEYVTLEPGFSVETGGVFRASIEVCEDAPAVVAEGESIEVNESLEAQADKDAISTQTDLIAFPNPFIDDFTLAYYLAEDDLVSLNVYDISGKRVKNLLNHEPQIEGTYKVRYESCNLQSGVYICVLETSKTRKVLKVLKK